MGSEASWRTVHGVRRDIEGKSRLQHWSRWSGDISRSHLRQIDVWSFIDAATRCYRWRRIKFRLDEHQWWTYHHGVQVNRQSQEPFQQPRTSVLTQNLARHGAEKKEANTPKCFEFRHQKWRSSARAYRNKERKDNNKNTLAQGYLCGAGLNEILWRVSSNKTASMTAHHRDQMGLRTADGSIKTWRRASLPRV